MEETDINAGKKKESGGQEEINSQVVKWWAWKVGGGGSLEEICQS